MAPLDLDAKSTALILIDLDIAHRLELPVDQVWGDPNAPPPPPEASELVPEAGKQPGDLLIMKRQWGAFFGTDLEAQLRSRGITTIVLGGIATNFGVESTARAAAGLGFALVVVEDATSTMSDEMHQFPFKYVFPRLGRVRSTLDVLDSLGA